MYTLYGYLLGIDRFHESPFSGLYENLARESPAATRGSTDILLGVSTRAATWLLLAAKTFAALRGRDFVTPDDVKFLAVPAWRHRLILRPEAEIEGLDADAVLARVLAQVDVPR